MTSQVYRLHSTLELPLETVYDYFEGDPDLPSDIDSVDITRRNNTLIISAVSDDESISKYTPTAQLKASVSETRVYTAFKGDLETVLQNTALQFSMFEVLCEIARLAEKGTLTAITEVNGDLQATRIVDGDDRPATIEVVEGPGENANKQSGVNWRDNEFISG